MAKGHNESNRENDYIEQVHWRSRHRMRWPVAYEPNWKFKVRYKLYETTLFGKFVQLVMFVGGLYIFYRVASSIIFSQTVELPGKIFFCVLISMIAGILFFAIRDASKKKIRPDDPEDH